MSVVNLFVDGSLVKTWNNIDLDQVFVLKHVEDFEVSEQIEITWTGKIAINQLYIVPENPVIVLR